MPSSCPCPSPSAPPIYHEKQAKQLCALHALNNLFQEDAFSQRELDAICRKNPNCLNLETLKGFILNIPNPSYNSTNWMGSSLFSLPMSYIISRKHWIAVRRVERHEDGTRGLFYNLDSKLAAPQLIGNDQDLIDYLQNMNRTEACEIFVVVTKTVAESGTWVLSDF